MHSKRKKIPIRLDFEGEEAEKFVAVKKWLGLKQNTEVVRAVIFEKYNEMKRLEKERIEQRIREEEAMRWLEHGEFKCPM